MLLLFVPVMRGLQGQLPIELSTRGARWQETITASERALAVLGQKVDAVRSDIDDLGRLVPNLVTRIAAFEEATAVPRGLFRRRIQR